MERSKHKLELLDRIAEFERQGMWHLDVEDDPETYPLMADDVDYLGERLSSRIKTRIANAAATRFFDKMIKERQLIIKEVRGLENFSSLTGGRIVTCNHFSVGDNYAVWVALRDAMQGRKLYKVIREGNYTNPPKPFGLFMKHCNTLPLSSQPSTVKKLMRAIRTLLARGETILIYPEQGMWWNYRKPRPLKEGAFRFAARAGAPVVPFFITMEDTETYGADGFPLQAYTVHILKPIYPDTDKNVKQNALEMKEKNYLAWKEVYEQTYGIPLTYTTVTENKCTTQQQSQQQM